MRLDHPTAEPAPSVSVVTNVRSVVLSTYEEDFMEVDYAKGQRRTAKEHFTRLNNKKAKKKKIICESKKRIIQS